MNIYCAPRGELGGHAAAYALLRRVFARDYGGDLPIIEKTPNGKPFFPERPGIHFSISHTKTHVLCALSNSPIGADIESPRYISRTALGFFASPEELALFEPLDLWVLKESYLKLLGGTLPLVRKMRFGRVSNEIVLKSSVQGNNELAFDRSPLIFRLYKVDGCCAAVASAGAIPPGSIELLFGLGDRG